MKRHRRLIIAALILGALAMGARFHVFDNLNLSALAVALGLGAVSWLLIWSLVRTPKHPSAGDLRGLRFRILEQRLGRIIGRADYEFHGYICFSGVFMNKDRLEEKILFLAKLGTKTTSRIPGRDVETEWLEEYFWYCDEYYMSDDRETQRQWDSQLLKCYVMNFENECGFSLDPSHPHVWWPFMGYFLNIRSGNFFASYDYIESSPSNNTYFYFYPDFRYLDAALFEPFRDLIESKMGRRVVIKQALNRPEFVCIMAAPELPDVISLLQRTDRKLLLGTDVDTGQEVVLNPDAIPHTLVVGQSGSGKSVWMHSFIVGLRDNTNHKVYLVDLKYGVEFLKYKSSNTFNKDSRCVVVGNWDDLVTSVAELVKVMEARFAEMIDLGLSSYPHQRIGIIIDEFAQIQLWPCTTKEERAVRDDVINKLTRISMLGRAAGMYLIAAIQKPTTDVMDSSLRNNLSATLCFRVGSKLTAATMLGGVEGMPADPTTMRTGRFLYYDSEAGKVRFMQSHKVTG